MSTVLNARARAHSGSPARQPGPRRKSYTKRVSYKFDGAKGAVGMLLTNDVVERLMPGGQVGFDEWQ